MVRKAIEKNGKVGTAEYSLFFSSDWKNATPKSLLAATLLNDIQVQKNGSFLTYPMGFTYYPSGILLPLESGQCEGDYQRSLLKALKLIEKNFLPDETTSDALYLGFTPDYDLDNSMFNYDQNDVNSDSDESELQNESFQKTGDSDDDK